MKEFVRMQKKFVDLINNTHKFEMIPQAVLIEGLNELALNKAVSYLCGAIFCDDEIYDYTAEKNQKYLQRLSSDIIEHDLKDDNLRKEDILRIQAQFSKTALEASNKQVYIIKNVDKSSSIILNALLKFLEEPHNNVYAIFTTNNSAKVLETITSRMIKIQLAANEINYIKESYYENYLQEDVDFVCLISNDEVHIKDVLDSEIYSDYKNEINNILNAKATKKLFIHLHELLDNREKDDLRIFFELFYITMLNIETVPLLKISDENIVKIKSNQQIDLILDLSLSSRINLDTNMNTALLIDEFSIKLERKLL